MTKQEFEILYKTYHKRLCWFANDIIKDEKEAEDIVSISFMKVHEEKDSGKWSSDIKIINYLYAVVRNACYDYRKINNRLVRKIKTFFYSGNDAEDYMEARIIKSEVLHLLSTAETILPHSRLEIIKMKFIEEMDYSEIAELKRLNINTVRVQVKRGLEGLRKIYLGKQLKKRFDGHSHPIIGTNAVTGEEFIFPSIQEAASVLSIRPSGISKVVTGVYKSSAGYYWRYST